mmetsp:Transcript_98079/g.316264  ORF Transcript_98079/g.316264 Transcript_98079/m.316264 type:complete len:204 (-) Transcript_98079:2095-2706(-)
MANALSSLAEISHNEASGPEQQLSHTGEGATKPREGPSAWGAHLQLRLQLLWQFHGKSRIGGFRWPMCKRASGGCQAARIVHTSPAASRGTELVPRCGSVLPRKPVAAVLARSCGARVRATDGQRRLLGRRGRECSHRSRRRNCADGRRCHITWRTARSCNNWRSLTRKPILHVWHARLWIVLRVLLQRYRNSWCSIPRASSC